MLTVACVLYEGKDVPSHSKDIFTPEWVDKLYRGVRRNLTQPFEFVCFVDKDYIFEERISVRKLELPYRNMLSLLESFKLKGKVLFMGLDTVITGNIDHIANFDTQFAMTRDPNNPKIGCSGVMLFENPGVWEKVKEDHENIGRNFQMCRCPSDMKYLTTIPHDYLDDMGIYSYKVHIKKNRELLDDARIIYFHGREKPHEIKERFVDEHWR